MAKLRFTKGDVERAAAGALAAGLSVSRVEIDSEGKVVVVTSAESVDRELTPLEKWRADRAAS